MNQADIDFYKKVTKGCSDIAAKLFAQRVSRLLKDIHNPSREQIIKARQKAIRW